MVNEEILGGLRNALERGSSIERAVQSFINAGYNPNDVSEAADYLSRGVMSMVHPEAKPATQSQSIRTAPMISGMPPAPAFTPMQPYPMQSAKPSFSSFVQGDEGKIILIGGIILSLLIIFGALGFVLVKYAL